MTATDPTPKATANRDFIISRTFDAPRDLVFKSWTDPERMSQWWGPRGFTSPVCKLDLRPGGSMHYCLRSPEGREMWGKFAFREVAAPERLVYVNSFSDPEGGLTRHPMSPTWPLELLSTITFEEHEEKTKLIVRWGLLPSATEPERKTFNEGHSAMQQGWAGTLDQLAAYLKTAVDIPEDLVFTHVFDADAATVFDAWTDAARVAQWWGPECFTNPVCKIDPKPGGAIRIDMRSPEGTVYPMTGMFQEVVRPHRLSFISTPLDLTGQPLFEALTSVELHERNGKTTQTVRFHVNSATPEAAPYLEGSEPGWTQTLERLDVFLKNA